MLEIVEGSAESVVSTYVQAFDLVRFDRSGEMWVPK